MLNNTRRITQWLCAELVFILSVISAVMFGVLSSSIEKTMNISAGELGWLSGIFFIVYALTQFYSGRLLVIVAVKSVLLGSCLIAAAGIFLFSHAEQIAWMFVARILLGIGLASTFVGVLYVIQNSFVATKFPFMSSLSQSLANLCAGVFGVCASTLMARYDFRELFNCLGIAFVLCAILIGLFFKSNSSHLIKSVVPNLGLFSATRALIRNSQVWLAAVYFTGLFGAILTFADLFDVAFITQAFNKTYSAATVINGMIPFGLTLGGLVAGYLAQRLNNYLLAARVLGFLAVLMFMVIMFVKFDPSESFLIASLVCFVFGIGCGGSILAFQCLQENVCEVSLRPLATSFVLTFAYIFSGLVEQPLVGTFIANTKIISTHLAPVPPHLREWIFQPSLNANWYRFDNGLYVILFTLVISFIASLFFKHPVKLAK